MIKINTLHGLEDISSCYEFNPETLEVVNATTGHVKKVCVSKRGYAVVYLTTNGDKKRNVGMHVIVALAMHENRPYELIEHLNDIKTDYRPENLAFSSKRKNGLRAFDNGRHKIHERLFRAEISDGTVYIGNMREISDRTGVSRMTLYDNLLYRNGYNKRHNFWLYEIGQQTIERLGNSADQVE